MSGEVKVEQRTEEWHRARAGKITASRFSDVMAFSKRDGKPLKARQDYAVELAIERLTGKSQGIPMSMAMQWGVDVEPAARSAYEARYGIIVSTPGFIVMDNGFIGCSPDGVIETGEALRVDESNDAKLAGGNGGLELKCPFNPSVHVATILEGMPEEHIPQVQGTMMVLNTKWWDFGSYDPRMPPELQLYVQRIARDEAYITELLKQCESLNAEADAMVAALRERMK